MLRPGDDRGRERILARAAARLLKPRYGLRDRLLGGRRILHQVGDDQIDRHGIVVGMPAVVVRDQGERRVAELGFARELRFLQVGHADDVQPPRPIQLGFGMTNLQEAKLAREAELYYATLALVTD